MNLKNLAICVLAIGALLSCKPKFETVSPISDILWENSDSIPIRLITLTNNNKMQIKITNYGGILTYVAVPDKAGVIENVVLGFDSLAPYKLEHPYFGSTIGRYGNRIGGAKFSLNDSTYTLAANNGPNTLHGGIKSFGRQVFTIDSVYASGDSMFVVLSRLSRDMEEGFPGNLQVQVTYVFTNNNEIGINYEASTDKPTVINLTNHSYFNLTGGKESILEHELILYADSITPTDENLIPTGVLSPVSGLPLILLRHIPLVKGSPTFREATI